MYKKLFILCVIGLVIISLSSEAKDNVLKTTNDSLSYAIGMQIGEGFKKDSLMLNLDLVKAGMDIVLNDDTSKALMNQQQIRECLVNFQRKMMMKQQQAQKVVQQEQASQAAENRKKGTEFLEKNKLNEGVVQTISGLQYKVIKKGSGEKPKDTDKVQVNYRGTLIDGTEFDKSPADKPIEFGVKGVIKGWTEALQLMNEGSKWILYIPADLAYGDRAVGKKIPGGSTLIFEVELIKIVK